MTDEHPAPDGDGGQTSRQNQHWIERAADLVLATEILPGPATVPDLATLRDRARRRTMRRRIVLGGISLTAATALGALLVTAGLRRENRPPLSYVVEGAATVQADSIEASPLANSASVPGAVIAAGAGARVRFTDGTAVILDPGARLRVPTRGATGANLILDRGRASFAVTHRPGANWHVMTGPFTVDVTGTRFSLAWVAQRLTLNLEAGGVIVRGSGAGPGISVRPGQTLVASASDGRFTVTATSLLPISDGAVPPNPGVASDLPKAVAQATKPADAMPRSARSTVALASPGITSRRGPRHREAASVRGQSGQSDPGRDGESRLDLQPPSLVVPSAPSLVLGGGGVFCARENSGFGFEGSAPGVSVPPVYHLAMGNPRADNTHSWCGVGSVKLDLNFHETGRPNFMGRLPNQSGQMVIRLPHLIDFTDLTVSLHLFIDGPSDARIAVQLYVIHHGKWVNGPVMDHLVPRRWWTISHTYRAENALTVGPPYPPGGTSLVTDCDRIALVVYSTGGPRTWTGAIYVDDIGWK